MSRAIANQGLAALLKNQNVLIKELRNSVNLSRHSLWAYQRGQNLPSVEEKLSVALNLSPRDLRRSLFGSTKQRSQS